MRLLPAALFFVALGANAGWNEYVDLDKPGALEALQVSNPSHYRQVMERVSKENMACEGAWSSLKIASSLRSACKTHLLMTSYPPKGHLTVRLDDVLYAITVSFDTSDYKARPAR